MILIKHLRDLEQYMNCDGDVVIPDDVEFRIPVFIPGSLTIYGVIEYNTRTAVMGRYIQKPKKEQKEDE